MESVDSFHVRSYHTATSPVAKESKKKWGWWSFLFVLFVLFSYANQLIYRYQVPPGGDAINHNQVVVEILAGHWKEAFHYHLVWHAIVALIVKLTHVRPITVMAWLGPMLLVGGGFTLFFFNKKYFGPVAGIISLVLFGFFSRQPLQTLYDGGFPDVLAGAIVLPLVIMALESVFTSHKKLLKIFIFLASLILLFYSHHLTTLFALPVIAIYLLIQLLLWMKQRQVSGLIILLTPIILIFVFLLLAGQFLHILSGVSSAGSLASMFVSINWHWPFIHFIGQVNDPNQIFHIANYPDAIGEALVYLGLGGIVPALFYSVKESHTSRGRISLFILIWVVILFLGSRNPHLGFPSRLMRDLAIPFTILGGIFVQAVYNFCKDRTIPSFLLVIFLILSLGLGWQTFIDRTQAIFSPNPLVYHVPADTKMASWIDTNLPPNTVIAIFPGDIYLRLFVSNTGQLINPSEPVLSGMTNPDKVPVILPGVQYIYFSYRLDQPESGTNNQSNLNSYKKSSTMQLVKQEIQPNQAEIDLFKVVKPVKKLATQK